MIPVTIVNVEFAPERAVFVDPDALSVSCTIGMRRSPKEKSLLEQVDAFMGIRGSFNVLTVGEVELGIDSCGMIRELDWRAGPNNLSRRSLAIFESAPASCVSLAVEWDHNQRADIVTRTYGLFDSGSRTLRIKFSDDQVQWFTIATGVQVAVSEQSCLSAIQIENLSDDLYALVHGKAS